MILWKGGIINKEEIKQAVLDFFESKKKTKTKFYMNELHKGVCGNEVVNKREFKKIINEMIADNILMYYSTGSTTMIQLAVEDVDVLLK